MAVTAHVRPEACRNCTLLVARLITTQVLGALHSMRGICRWIVADMKRPLLHARKALYTGRPHTWTLKTYNLLPPVGD